MDKRDHLAFSSFLTKNFPLVNEHPDVAGLLRDPYILQNLGAAMASSFHDGGITKVIAPEARGPVLGALVALGVAAVMLTKPELRPRCDRTGFWKPARLAGHLWRGSCGGVLFGPDPRRALSATHSRSSSPSSHVRQPWRRKPPWRAT